MLLTRSPLRISLGGGRSTDLPSYYRKHGGFLIAAAINKYVYIALQRTYVEQLIIRYSKYENVTNVGDVKHPIIREALTMVGHDGRFLEITSMADIASGTGLGSSGSFGTAPPESSPRLATSTHPGRTNRRPGLRNRNQPAQGTCRQAGPIHFRPSAASPVLNFCPMKASRRGLWP